MLQQGPIVVVSTGEQPSLITTVADTRMFPLIETVCSDALQAIATLGPAAVIVDAGGDLDVTFPSLAQALSTRQPYVPLIVIDPQTALPVNALPFKSDGDKPERLNARLHAALRVRTLHSTVLRRLADDPSIRTHVPDTDPVRDATVLLIGRGAAYPALSVALGERTSVMGALSIEAAAKHLNACDVDGIVLGEGFSHRVIDAFLMVLAEDARFRNLPVVVAVDGLTAHYDLPNLEFTASDPVRIATNALPLIRQHAFEAHLGRTLKSIDAGGLLDPRTGLLTIAAFARDFATIIEQSLSRGGGLSVARFSFDTQHERVQLDGARIASRLMRRMDFGVVQDDGSIVVVFAETDLRSAHMIARRLSSVMKHTMHAKRETRVEPDVTVATLQPTDTALSILNRLHQDARRVAS